MDQVDSNQSSIPTLLSDSPMSQEGGSSSDVENTDEFPVVSLEQAAQEALHQSFQHYNAALPSTRKVSSVIGEVDKLENLNDRQLRLDKQMHLRIV